MKCEDSCFLKPTPCTAHAYLKRRYLWLKEPRNIFFFQHCMLISCCSMFTHNTNPHSWWCCLFAHQHSTNGSCADADVQHRRETHAPRLCLCVFWTARDVVFCEWLGRCKDTLCFRLRTFIHVGNKKRWHMHIRFIDSQISRWGDGGPHFVCETIQTSVPRAAAFLHLLCKACELQEEAQSSFRRECEQHEQSACQQRVDRPLSHPLRHTPPWRSCGWTSVTFSHWVGDVFAEWSSISKTRDPVPLICCVQGRVAGWWRLNLPAPGAPTSPPTWMNELDEQKINNALSLVGFFAYLCSTTQSMDQWDAPHSAGSLEMEDKFKTIQ